jgi:hypothetical protein
MGAKQHPALEVADLLILSLWVAICAMTPEFIWRGVCIAIGHVDKDMVVTSLLFGLILGFCIEPGLERLRHRLERRSHEGDAREEPRSLLLTAGMGLVFAIVSICLHDSIAAFFAGHEEGEAARHLALINGLEIAVSWAIIPFCVTLAWIVALCTIQPWRYVALILAAISPVFASWFFSWGWQDGVTTTLPALAVLMAGWRKAQPGQADGFFRQSAGRLCWIAVAWLVAAALISVIANTLDFRDAVLYSPDEFWIDARFYLGWAAGLLIISGLPREWA